MAQLVSAPTVIEAAGSPPKQIEEYVGLVRTGSQTASVARMVSPSGWSEPGQRPDFQEVSLVIAGELVAELVNQTINVSAGQALLVDAGEWVRYSTPGRDGAVYVSVCVPAFAPDRVHRDTAGHEEKLPGTSASPSSEPTVYSTPRELVLAWVEHFNAADAEGLASLYDEDAVNHQVTQDPIEGRDAIKAMFEQEFAAADMTCIVDTIHEAGDTAALEWRDPNGLRGCGFFTVKNGRIAFQRGYWDKLSFLKLNGLPIE